MVPVIAWTLGIKAAVPILTVAMRLGNGARMWFSRSEIDGRVVAAFLAGAVPVGIVGATLYSRADGLLISRILGVFLLLAVPLRRWLKSRGVRVRLRHFPFVGGAYIATDALCTVGAYATRLAVFQRYDLLTRPTVAIGLFLGAVMILGSWLGRRLLDRLSEERFVRLVEALLVSFAILFLLFPSR
jgi:uncharacterized membrane protein YfcA